MQISNKERCLRIMEVLASVWKKTQCDLHYSSPFQLLVASVLAARTYDETVNRVMPPLMETYPDAWAMSVAQPSELQSLISEVTYPESKAQYLVRLSNQLVSNYQGEVPNELSVLEKLPGVGRKSASLVCVEAWNIPAFPVDTHVMKVCNRTHVCVSKDPIEVERALVTYLKREEWRDSYRRLVKLGKEYCKSDQPNCDECPVRTLCETYMPTPEVVQYSLW